MTEIDNTENGFERGCRLNRHGPTSYWMQDADVVFNELDLRKGDCFLDLGSGPGDYSVRASSMIGESGRVYALDKWKVMTEALQDYIAEKEIKNIKPLTADITGPLPIDDHCVDVALLAAVFYIINRPENRRLLFQELRRVLKPRGRIAIIECKKEEQDFGPPEHIRLSPEQLDDYMSEFGFTRVDYIDLGFNYMIQFSPISEAEQDD